MTGENFCSALKSGQRVYGTLTVSDAARWPGMLASLGLDFVFIDTEHIAIDRAALSWMCQTYVALGVAPIVRIPSQDPFEATVALDAGANGIVAPYVETVEQVQALRGAVKCRPLKGQRLQRLLDGAPTEPELAGYIAERNADNTLIINVESVAAWENLDNLLAVPDLDGILIGPHDLSTTMGIPERYDHPDFDRAVTDIITRARQAGVGAGIHVTTGNGLNTEDEIRWVRAGANLIVHRADIIAAQYHLSRELGELRAAVGDAPDTASDSDLNI
jgi:2-keto-3-deoxy-L-rhamnonate aldolase RhmA